MYAKNFQDQPQFSISYDHINSRRDHQYQMNDGCVLHDFVPFYFSPITAMAFAIHRGLVPLTGPDGSSQGNADVDDVAFVVCNSDRLISEEYPIRFSDRACNTVGATFYDDDSQLDQIHWAVFNDTPLTAVIPEIGYNGVCKFFANRDAPAMYRNRKAERMAEFMVKDQVSMQHVDCIVVKNHKIENNVKGWLAQNGYDLPLLVKPDCYF